MRFRRHRTQGSTPPLGQEGCCSTPPPSLANFSFCEEHCLLPSGFGWKADDFIAHFDNAEIQCRHWTSGFCHSVLPPKEWDRFFGSKLREYYSENGTTKTSLSVKSKATIRLFLTKSESFSQQKCYIFSSKQEQNICRDRAPGHMYLWWSCWWFRLSLLLSNTSSRTAGRLFAAHLEKALAIFALFLRLQHRPVRSPDEHKSQLLIRCRVITNFFLQCLIWNLQEILQIFP